MRRSDLGKEALQIQPADLERQPKNETHHGDLGAVLKQDLPVAAFYGGNERSDEREQPAEPSSGFERRCDFCGRPCRCAGRMRPLPWCKRSSRRGPRLPGYIPARRR